MSRQRNDSNQMTHRIPILKEEEEEGADIQASQGAAAASEIIVQPQAKKVEAASLLISSHCQSLS